MTTNKTPTNYKNNTIISQINSHITTSVYKKYNVIDEKSRYKNYNEYRKGNNHMDKKDKSITFRTNEDLLNKIQKIALTKEWSVAKTVEKICQEYFKENNNEKNN